MIENQKNEAVKSSYECSLRVTEAEARVSSLVSRIENQEREIESLRKQLNHAHQVIADHKTLTDSVHNLTVNNDPEKSIDNNFCDSSSLQLTRTNAQISQLKLAFRNEIAARKKVTSELHEFQVAHQILECKYSDACKRNDEIFSEKLEFEKENASLRGECVALQKAVQLIGANLEKSKGRNMRDLDGTKLHDSIEQLAESTRNLEVSLSTSLSKMEHTLVYNSPVLVSPKKTPTNTHKLKTAFSVNNISSNRSTIGVGKKESISESFARRFCGTYPDSDIANRGEKDLRQVKVNTSNSPRA